jgi:hypothetical protein
LLHEGAMTTPTETTTNDEVAVQPFLERLEVEDTLHDMDNPPETIAVVEETSTAVVEETSPTTEEPETETSPPSDTAVVNEEPLPSSDTTTADVSQASSDGDAPLGDVAMRELLRQQRSQVAEDGQAAMVRAAAEDAQQLMTQLQSQGYAEEDARTQAQNRFEQNRLHLAYQSQIQTVQQETQAKMLVASKFAADYGVSVDSLLTFGTPQEMEASAKGRADTRKLKEENASLRKARVPNQTMEQTGSIAESNTSRYRILDDYAEGRRTEDDPLVKKALNI